MHTAQLLKEPDSNLSPDIDQLWGYRSRRSASGAVDWQKLSDCHSQEHLLLGTHQFERTSADFPICLTCRVRGAA